MNGTRAPNHIPASLLSGSKNSVKNPEDHILVFSRNVETNNESDEGIESHADSSNANHIK